MNGANQAADVGASRVPQGLLRRIGRGAIAALYDELALYPKPGLVSFVDPGSHADMDASTFMRSLFSLRHCFTSLAWAGAREAAFNELEQIGLEGESAMLRATGGINTHRGAIFSLGLLCAAAGSVLAEGQSLSPPSLRGALLHHWGPCLLTRVNTQKVSSNPLSNGQAAAQRHSLRSAGEEAALGFPVLFDVTLPVLQQATLQGLGPRRSQLQAFMHTLAVLADTNLAHRGGIDGLHWSQEQARGFLANGGAVQHGALERAQALHVEFVRRRLSPGGAADMLAAACALQRWGVAP